MYYTRLQNSGLTQVNLLQFSNCKFIFQDCNNLYGYAMMMKLPHSQFRWMSAEELENFDIDGFNVDGDYGVVLQVI